MGQSHPVGLANYSGLPFRGWHRTTIDYEPPGESGAVTVEGPVRDQIVCWVAGRRVGRDCRAIDVEINLAPGEAIEFELTPPVTKTACETPPPSPEMLAALGQPSIAGVPLRFQAAEIDGAAYLAHFRARVGPMLVVNLWSLWYPDHPGRANAEIQVTASNPAVPDVVAVIPPNFTLRFGDAVVTVAGRSPGAPLWPEGDTVADGAGLPAMSAMLVWPKLCTPEELASAAAAPSISAIGVRKVWPLGNPLPVDDPLEWSQTHYGRALTDTLGWKANNLGIHADAYTTGGEGDQVFVGGECAQGVRSLGTEMVNWFVAAGYARRPVHHLEATGDLLDINGHPDLCLWDGRHHYIGGSRDESMKTVNRLLTHGWWDWAEHEFWNRLAVAYRLTGSPALQWQIEAQARQFLFQNTTDPRFSTSRAGVSREWGWKCLVAYHLWHNLDDRTLATVVRDRWLELVRTQAIPKWSGELFWGITDDPRLHGTGFNENCMTYQQAPAAYFTHLCATEFGDDDAKVFALAGALAVVDYAFSHDGNRWKGWGYVAWVNSAPGELVQGAGAAWGAGIESWMVTAPATVLRADPNNEKARAIVDQHIVEANQGGKWIPPEVLR